MPNLNSVTLLGHAGQDAELEYGESGTPYVKLSIATNSKGKNKENITDWHKVVCFGYSVKNAAKIKKGDAVYVQGTIRYSTYKDEQGNQRRNTSIIAFKVYRLDYAHNEAEEDVPF